MRIALATCVERPDLTPDEHLLVDAMRARGMAPEAAIWTEPSVAWERYDAVVIRTTWDYYEREGEFRAWLQRLEDRGVRVLNPVRTMLGNVDKRYLRALEAAGVPVVPTEWIEPGDDPRALEGRIAARGWMDRDLVVKPAVAAGGFKTIKTPARALAARPDAVVDIIADRVAMVQPFMPEILAEGEWSFLYFGDAFSHAVLKTAKPGEFRVQWTLGGTHRKAEPPTALRAAADRIFGALDPLVGGGRLYTRIDGVAAGGGLLLMELELIEPYLFLAEDAEAPGRMAAALEQLLAT